MTHEVLLYRPQTPLWLQLALVGVVIVILCVGYLRMK